MVPMVYTGLAASTKKTEHLVVQEAANKTARDLNLSKFAPVITPDLAKLVTHANFTHPDVDAKCRSI